MSTVIYLKQFKAKERKEMKFENWESLTVKKLKEIVSTETGVPLDELSIINLRVVYLYFVITLITALIFNGRVLKLNNSLLKYKMASGCTLFYIKNVTKLSDPQQETQEYDSSFNALVSNRKVLTMIGRMLSSPSLLQTMLAGTPLEGNQAITDALSNPELLSSFSNPDTIEEYLRENPHMASLMEGMLRMHQFGLSGSEGEEAVEMVEERLEGDIEGGQEEHSRMAQEQEDMFEHSRAIQAHQQQTQAITDSPQDSSDSQASSSHPRSGASMQWGSIQRQNSGGTITQDLLSSALAGAMGSSQQSSPLSSLSISNSGPPSLSAYANQSTTQPIQASSDSRRSEQVGSIGQQASITSEDFQQALASAFGNIPTPSGLSRDSERRLTPMEKYRAQLEQLHFMGILDDALSIQALDAAGGDLQAALEIIYTR